MIKKKKHIYFKTDRVLKCLLAQKEKEKKIMIQGSFVRSDIIGHFQNKKDADFENKKKIISWFVINIYLQKKTKIDVTSSTRNGMGDWRR